MVAPTRAVSRQGNAFRHTHTGLRVDLGIVARSGWEANTMRILQGFDIAFEFEPKVFHFPIKRGTTGYCPDIYLTKTDEWVEVKGYFDSRSRIKIKRFKLYYPEEFAKLTLIIGKSKQSLAICESLEVPRVLYYPELTRLFRDQIPTWES